MSLFDRIKKAERPPQYGKYLFLLVCIWTLSFEEPITHLDFPYITLFRNVLPILAIAYFILDPYTDDSSLEGRSGFGGRMHALTQPMAVLGMVFAAAGIVGWIMNGYQTFSITVQAMYEHIRFWICLWAFMSVLSTFPLEKYAKRLFCHVGLLSAILIVLTTVDIIFHIWGRQIYRFGIGSIQLFYGHPSYFGAHCVFLLAMLCILIPYLQLIDDEESRSVPRWSVTATVLMCCMLVLVLTTIRTRLIGFVAAFIILFIYMIVIKKKLHPGIILVGVLAALAIGWQRIYFFYFSKYSYTMARGQFATNSLDIALNNMPFGAGFGTFGSRMAQIHYSPLYFKYHMMLTTGMQPTHPSYACDSFYPMILGESGWLGFIAYMLLIVLLIRMIFGMQRLDAETASAAGIQRMTVFTAMILVLYELSETTATLALSETYSVLIALALGLAIAKCRRPFISPLS